jgi:uncharacterized protein DUF1570
MSHANRIPRRSTGRKWNASERSRRIRPPRHDLCLSLLAGLLLLGGCRTARPETVRLPVKHSVRSEQLLVLSDVELKRDHALIQDLKQLRQDVAQLLKLPLEGREVVVYVFGDEQRYRRYLDETYPGLPPRRAYFVGSPRELAVYTFWGARIQEDLRHEFTHGLLHAQLKAVPLWLDEGLAEYFEVPRSVPNAINREYARRLTVAIANGWQPDLERLESLEEVSQMQRADYQESWAWVHFLLHGSDDTRQVLLDYLQELRDTSHPTRLSVRVAETLPEFRLRYVAYVATLNSIQPVTHER